jgi:peptidyl-tRNA hydrolase, PTH2 family
VGFKLVIAVRTDLGMSVGKTAAQVAHAAVMATLLALGTPDLEEWLLQGQTKVVVRVPSLEELRQRVARARQAGVRTAPVADAGHTELEPGTESCCAFGPASDVALEPVTGDLPLL